MLSTAKKLYDTDFNLWVEETANLLKEGKWEYLDLENLIGLFGNCYANN